jgi:hypothetical protein
MGDGQRSVGPAVLQRVCAGESVTVHDMVAASRIVTGKEPPVTYVPASYVPEQDLKSGLATVEPEFAEAAQ